MPCVQVAPGHLPVKGQGNSLSGSGVVLKFRVVVAMCFLGYR
jgi:hypothetical protein